MDRRIWWPLAVAAACMAVSGLDVASAKVPAAEADQLGNTLTCMGSPKAGTKDGLIPAWTGKWEGAPPYIHYTQEDANQGKRYPNAYPNDKPLFTITKANMAKYAEHLSQGEQALFNKYPDYRMVIYPSHRDWRYPDHVCKANKSNALHTEITDPQRGGFKDAVSGGVPFPIAKTGIEILLDATVTSVVPFSQEDTLDNADVLPNGSIVWGKTHQLLFDPAINPDRYGKPLAGVYSYAIAKTLLPLRSRGNVSDSADPVDYSKGERITWTYNQGTRRLSQVPVFGFDQPLGGTDGRMTIDSARIFNGSPERYNWKIIGSRELYIPSDNYDLQNPKITYKDLLLSHFVNPKYVRWELHRVYEYEATLRPEFRHIYPKRVLYQNADSHQNIMTDIYDAQGGLWRVGFQTTYWAYNAHLYAAGPQIQYDLKAGGYIVQGLTSEQPRGPIINDPTLLNIRRFSPAVVRAHANS